MEWLNILGIDFNLLKISAAGIIFLIHRSFKVAYLPPVQFHRSAARLGVNFNNLISIQPAGELRFIEYLFYQ